MSEQRVLQDIKNYKKKFYLNRILRGIVLSLSILLAIYILFASVEFLINLGSIGRGFLFFSFVTLAVFLIVSNLVLPFKQWYQDSGISDDEAASRIGSHYPTIKDRLLNFLQLSRRHDLSSDLVKASLNQRARNFSGVTFSEAINLRENQKYTKFLAPSIAIILAFILFVPQLLPSSTTRIVNYNKSFIPVAPFDFVVENNLLAFKNEDFQLNLKLSGSSIPQNAYLVHNGRRLKMNAGIGGQFSYVFQKIQTAKRVQFEAAGYESEEYIIEVVSRPNLRNFNVYLDYPNYLGKQNDRLENIGNLEIPQGTTVKWQFKTSNTKSLQISFDKKEESLEPSTESDLFETEKQFFKSEFYTINLKNEFTGNKDLIGYHVNVIPDLHPSINLNVFEDSVLYSYIVLGGNIADDYGITNLALHYKLFGQEENEPTSEGSIDLPFNRQQNSQSYFHRWALDSLDLSGGNRLEYYIQVWDNDQVNGIKSSISGTYIFKIPSEEMVEKEIAQSSEKTKSDMKSTIEQAEELEKKVNELEQELKSKKELDWQDELNIKELLEKREKLNQTITDLQNQFEAEKQKRERFQNQSDDVQKKVDELQALMDELLDEETKELYEELRRLLEEMDDEKVQDALENINNREKNMVEELERTLELYKKMMLDFKLDEAIQELDELAKEQESLSEETKDKSNSEQDLSDAQENLKEQFEQLEKDLEEIQDLNQELENPEPLEDFSEEQENTKSEMQDAQENLNDGKRKPASESQKNAAQEMQKMKQEMQNMQQSMESQTMQANLNDLREILYNLITLSFDQEDLMKEFRAVDQSDPRFVDLGQEQLKIKEDSKIIEDSLISLARRARQIGAFVTREVAKMNSHLDNSIGSIRDRKKAKATAEQQFAMTSMNNLALMLDDVMSQMQQNMSPGKGQKQDGEKQMSLSDLQKQLNNKIEQLQNGEKTGRQLSEELAKLAAEQERIRQALQEMESQLNEGEGPSRNQIGKKMEQTETDLVNKRITAETIKRQREILTRLLEAENSKRERELDNRREGETAKSYENALPKAFEEYFKAKEKEVELLKTVPPKLYPYYKKEVNDYFQRIGNKN